VPVILGGLLLLGFFVWGKYLVSPTFVENRMLTSHRGLRATIRAIDQLGISDLPTKKVFVPIFVLHNWWHVLLRCLIDLACP
jgi:hypothetical protein